MDKPLPCIVCKKKLEPALKDVEEYVHQPAEACTFITYGNYGSEVFDPMPISNRVTYMLQVNVCDKCILQAVEDKTILAVTKTVNKATYLYQIFDPEAPQGY